MKYSEKSSFRRIKKRSWNVEKTSPIMEIERETGTKLVE